MKVLKMLSIIIGWLWALPMTILSLPFSLFLVIAGQLKFWQIHHYMIFEFVVIKGSLLDRIWMHKFLGVNMAGVDWYSYRIVPTYGESLTYKHKGEEEVLLTFKSSLCREIDLNPEEKSTLVHERRHALQTYVFGIFQPILYVIFTLWIFAFHRSKHSYYDNPFERDARRTAGQNMMDDINWAGKKRWLWW
jgi:hypothetical protein